MKTGRRLGIPELKKKDFLSHKSHSRGFIMIVAYYTFPSGSTEVMQRDPLRMLPESIGYVKEERWASFNVRASLLSGLGLCIGYIPHLSCILAVNTLVRNFLGKGSQALHTCYISKNVKQC